MFPHARNSLRRWSTSEKGSKRVPIPIGVSLHNVMAAPLLLPSQDGTPITAVDRWFRPNHETRLLPLLKLEILVDEDGEETGSTEDKLDSMEDMQEAVADGNNYRVVYSSPIFARSVQPAWEHLDERIDLPGEWWRRGGLYRKMRLRISQIVSDDEFVQEEKTDKDKMARSSSHSTSDAHHLVFLEIPLHPSRLERLHREDIPTSLPPNACMVHYSDGSTRCAPNLFAVLLKNQLTEPSPVEDFSRFEDDVFRTLDGVPETPEMATRAKTESFSALLEPQDLDSRLIDEFESPEESENVLFEETMESASYFDDAKERERLSELIAMEEDQLQDELGSLREAQHYLASSLKEAEDMEGHISRIATETDKQGKELRKDELRKQALQMKLLRELHTVYPIHLDSKKGYLIRNLRLPVDTYTTGVSEEEISAALGFCCHLVFMISKYLGISLRYRLFCNSSRSAVQLDANTFLPLFISRMVEREHLDRAMTLLGSDVDCILMTIGIEFTPKSHILARLQRVYEHIIEGEIPLSQDSMT